MTCISNSLWQSSPTPGHCRTVSIDERRGKCGPPSQQNQPFRAGGACQSWQIAYLVEVKLRFRTSPALRLGPLMGKARGVNREEHSGITKAVWCWLQHQLAGNSWGVSGPKRSCFWIYGEGDPLYGLQLFFVSTLPRPGPWRGHSGFASH